jgi:hypothetical protein
VAQIEGLKLKYPVLSEEQTAALNNSKAELEKE